MPTASPNPDRQTRIMALGGQLLDEARHAGRGSFLRRYQEDQILGELMGDDALRVEALRFVDVLPALRRDEDLVRHLNEYLGKHDIPIPLPGLARLPGLTRWGMRHARTGLPAHLLGAGVRAVVGSLARRFIAGANAAEALPFLRRLHGRGMDFTLDVLGEATVSRSEEGGYQQSYLDLLEQLHVQTSKWGSSNGNSAGKARRSPLVNLSVKASALYSQIDPADIDGSVAGIKERLRPILLRARQVGAFINLDMEQYDTKEITLRVFRELLEEEGLRDWADAGVVLQAYLRETESDLERLLEWVERRGAPVTVRLVRGAYWDYETVLARQHGWATPVWTHKGETDACYERCLGKLLANHAHVRAAIATHNVRSLAVAMITAEELGLTPEDFEFQMLYGMADPLKEVLVKRGHRLRVYVPLGQLIPGMAYLVRRLLENTSSQSFLRMGLAEDVAAETLLAEPGEELPIADCRSTGLTAGRLPILKRGDNDGAAAIANPQSSIAYSQFRNEPLRRFTDPAESAAFKAAIELVRGQLGREYPLVIGGVRRGGGAKIESINPARPGEVVGRVAAGTEGDAQQGVAAAKAAGKSWAARPAEERGGYLRATAAVLRRRRDELAAWEIFEAGKTWREADADVCEAIDFLEYYAREAERLAQVQHFNAAGEINYQIYEARGVGAVIAPWNFPLAILTGMAAAAIAVGNAVVLKPAPQTPVIAAKLIEAMEEAGLPPGVVNFLPGADEAGQALVRHPDIHFIAFTGSEAVGRQIYEEGARVQAGQDHLKRIIAEMGGKNAIIVDADADLDDAVRGVVASAFGYQGQKCSAASRCIVVGELYEVFLKRLTAAAASLRMGMPEEAGTALGPVIDAAARERILAAIAEGKHYARLALETPLPPGLREGFFIGPTIFADVPPDSALAQQEIFGPVLAVMAARDFAAALDLANGTRYALTGGVYSRSPSHLELARRQFRVGNLYLNRRTTGALVGRQPFGGLKMSGMGSKTGGPDYLLQFVEPRVVTENTIRRGFAPE